MRVPVRAQVRRSPRVDVRNYFAWQVGSSFPAALALLYDADKAPTRELTGKGHKFNSSILSPQYQLGADGSYSNVGANPAVDTFDGEKWLRSCGAVENLFGGDTSQARAASLTSGTVYTLQVFGAGEASCSYGTATVSTPLIFTATATELATFTPDGATLWMLTATSYPVPYTPPGTTMPASNATVTNGCWFTLADGSPVWNALSGGAMTLATRDRMGISSADLASSGSGINIVACTANTGCVLNYAGGATPRASLSFDRTNYAWGHVGPWNRDDIILRFTQIDTAGTKFRVGHMMEGVHTTIQWGGWTTYDGSFNPSTLYRLMLGYNNPYPMWYNKIAVWKEQVSDERILEALA